MSYVETKDLRLNYYDYLGYLAPHAVRTFTNSLAWQRRMFGWVPSEPHDRPAAGLRRLRQRARRSPRRATCSIFDVAPLSHAFETYPASERMYSLMNHELVHVVQSDIASEEDRRWRRFFLGKVAAAVAATPKRCSTATSRSRASPPRAGTPRAARSSSRRGWAAAWAARRAATTRWCSGRWCATTPTSTIRSGSRRAASRSTSRPARTPTSTARASSPGSRTPIRPRRSSPGSGATRAASATTPTSSSRCSACRSSRPGRTGSRSSTSSSDATSPRSASSRSRRTATWSRARWARSRACTTTRRPASSTAPSAIPGVVEHVGALEHARRQRAAARRHQGRDALQGHVVRLRPGAAAPPSTPTTTTRCAT